MAAIGLVKALRAKTRVVDRGTTHDDDYPWGTYKASSTSRLTLQRMVSPQLRHARLRRD